MYGTEKAIRFGAEGSRRDAARASLDAFITKQQNKLAARLCDAEAAIKKADEPSERARLQNELAKIEREQQEFRLRCVSSSLRRSLSTEQDNESGIIEKRIAPAGGYAITRTVEPYTEPQTKITGYAAVFDRLSVNLGGWQERIDRHAFDGVVKTADVRLLRDHDSSLLFGRTKSGTLRLGLTDYGLGFWSYLPATPQSQDLISAISRGDLTQCSFAFTVKRDTWRLAARIGELDTRIVLEIDNLLDVSCVTYPAYPDTICQVVQEREMTADEYSEWWDTEGEDQMLMEQIENKQRTKRLENLSRDIKLGKLQSRIRAAQAKC